MRATFDTTVLGKQVRHKESNVYGVVKGYTVYQTSGIKFSVEYKDFWGNQKTDWIEAIDLIFKDEEK